jgi:diguanylate cyclase (GGDEF)-like protein
MASMTASGELESPPLRPGFIRGLLDAFPAVLMVLDTGGRIRYAAGQLDALGDRTSAQLVGSKVGDFVATPDERSLVEELVTVAASRPDGYMVGPVRVPYFDGDGTAHLTEVWVVNRSSAADVGGLVVMLSPESAYDYFDQVLASIVQNAPLEETFGAIAEALRHPPFGGECYFLTPATDDRAVKRLPDTGNVPGPPLPGPWDGIWAGATSVEHENLSRLSPPLREQAMQLGYASVACFSVHPGLEGRAEACLVAWSAEEGRLTPFARRAIEQAIVIASLAISHRPEGEGVTETVLRDPLTGLANRRSFFEALGELVEAGEQPAVMYIDLDGFKAVNDQLGNLAGDAVLRVVARRLASVMRPTDELARLAGDGFAVLCNGAPTAEQMEKIAERVVEQLSQPLSVGDGQTVFIGASIGIALEQGVGTPVDTILGRVDHALNEAKEQGRGRWVLVSGPD